MITMMVMIPNKLDSEPNRRHSMASTSIIWLLKIVKRGAKTNILCIIFISSREQHKKVVNVKGISTRVQKELQHKPTPP